MTAILLGLVVGGTVCGDLLKAFAMRSLGPPSELGRAAVTHYAAAVANRWMLLAISAYAVSFFAFMALLSIRDVSFAVPATALAYALETVLARWLLRERIHWRRWIGAGLVAAGVWMIA